MKGRPIGPPPEESAGDQKLDGDNARGPRAPGRPRPTSKTRSRTPRRERAAERAKEERRRRRSLINDRYRIHIPGDRWTYLQLLLPLEEWPYVRLYEQLPVGVDDRGIRVYRSFVSPKDPGIGGPAARDPIEERVLRDRGYPPRDRYVGVAAELERCGGGFAVATRVQDGEVRPNVGLVVQASFNFFRPLHALRLDRDAVIAARKRGTGIKTRYEFARAADAIQITVDADLDLDAFLEGLADETEMEAVLRSPRRLAHGRRRPGSAGDAGGEPRQHRPPPGGPAPDAGRPAAPIGSLSQYTQGEEGREAPRPGRGAARPLALRACVSEDVSRMGREGRRRAVPAAPCRVVEGDLGVVLDALLALAEDLEAAFGERARSGDPLLLAGSVVCEDARRPGRPPGRRLARSFEGLVPERAVAELASWADEIEREFTGPLPGRAAASDGPLTGTGRDVAARIEARRTEPPRPPAQVIVDRQRGKELDRTPARQPVLSFEIGRKLLMGRPARWYVVAEVRHGGETETVLVEPVD